jgi:hypothetical protein
MQPTDRARRNPRRNGEHSPQVPKRERLAAIRGSRQHRRQRLTVTADAADLRKIPGYRPNAWQQ